MILWLLGLAMADDFVPPAPIFVPRSEHTEQRRDEPLPVEFVVCLSPEVKLHFGRGKVQTALYPAGVWLPEGSRANGHGP